MKKTEEEKYLKAVMIMILLMVSVSGASVSYSLTTDKETYDIDEPIFIDFSVTNETEKSIF